MQPQAEGYGTGAKSLHWVTAALVGSQFLIGWIMPGLQRVTQAQGLVSLHFSLGLLILMVTAVRLLWRLAHGVPAFEVNLPIWQQRAADVLHATLYVLLAALVFSGWAYASSHGIAVTFFGLAMVPALFVKGSAIGQVIGNLHSAITWVLLGALGLHVAAALAHSLIWRDRVMSRMLPRLG